MTAMTAADLAVIEGHLRADGIFTAHARTDVLTLLAEVRRLRHTLTVARVELDRHHAPAAGRPVAISNGGPS